jgi:TonB-linked SusC/RagA family outer membrane protein
MSPNLLKHTLMVARSLVLATFLQVAFCSVLFANESNAVSGITPSIMRQDRTIKGIVTDENGQGIPGVNVIVKGTSEGTTTDADGAYTLSIADNNVTLVFTFIGYETKEEPIAGRSTVSLTLLPDVKTLDEVTVVAFGEQKKESVVSSISTIRPSELKVPSSNLTTALAGRLSGVIAYQRSGEPGRDNAEFFIRGATTFGYKKEPLILIDGMEYTTTELARLTPDDIESFSIMKDATANALYGARGANGVIQITTKSGKEGKAKLTFRLENTISRPTRDVKMADPVTYMKLHNESVLTRNPLGVLPNTQYKIESTEAGVNPIVFPAVDWQKMLFKEQTVNQRANMSLSGGGKIASYYVSSSFNQDNGVLKVDKRNDFNSNISMKTYNLRSNIGINVTSTTNLMIRLSGTFDDYRGPLDGGKDLYEKVMRTSQTLFPAYYPAEGDYANIPHIMFGNSQLTDPQTRYINPYADMVKGYKESSRSIMLAQFELKQDLGKILKGLTFNGMVNTNRRASFDVTRQMQPFWYNIPIATNYDKVANTYRLNLINPGPPDQGGGTDWLEAEIDESKRKVSSAFRGQGQLLWKNTFNNKHDVSAMAVLLAQSELTGNPEDVDENDEVSLQESLPARNLGLSGRATYGYDNRYFFEFNFGYNGSERFHESERFGFFPSAGVAWSISGEPFFEPFERTFNKLRVRANYGLVGNDAIGSKADRFFYISDVNMNNDDYSASFGTDGGYTRNGISVGRYQNEAITWETAVNSTFGLEIGLFDKLNFIGEFFTERRYNILMDRASIPVTMGLMGNKPKANVGKASTKAIDLSLDYSNQIGRDLILQVRGNFTFARNKFVAYEEPEYDHPWLYKVGHSTSQEWGYVAERLFVDGDSWTESGEVGSSPVQSFGRTMGGDIKYKDINHDGVINTLDQVPIGFPTTPEVIYGFGFSSKYKSFDINAFFQGSGRSSFWIDVEKTSPFIDNDDDDDIVSQNQLLKAYADDHWSEEDRNLYALWPRLNSELGNNNNQQSTWFMRDGSFLRLKQVEVGYTLPVRLSQRIRMDILRLYFNATNLYTWSKFKLWDVEMAGEGMGYPIQKQFNIGLQVGL